MGRYFSISPFISDARPTTSVLRLPLFHRRRTIGGLGLPLLLSDSNSAQFDFFPPGHVDAPRLDGLWNLEEEDVPDGWDNPNHRKTIEMVLEYDQRRNEELQTKYRVGLRDLENGEATIPGGGYDFLIMPWELDAGFGENVPVRLVSKDEVARSIAEPGTRNIGHTSLLMENEKPGGKYSARFAGRAWYEHES